MWDVKMLDGEAIIQIKGEECGKIRLGVNRLRENGMGDLILICMVWPFYAAKLGKKAFSNIGLR
jgi:hypothetical protein